MWIHKITRIPHLGLYQLLLVTKENVLLAVCTVTVACEVHYEKLQLHCMIPSYIHTCVLVNLCSVLG